MSRIFQRLRRPAAFSFGFGLSAALPAHQFLINPPSNARLLGLPMMESGELNLWGYVVGVTLTVGFACFGTALILASTLALRYSVRGGPPGNCHRSVGSRSS